MEPIQSYRIWFTQRSGSTLLCKALESTQIAGIPGEYFNIDNDSSFCKHYQVNSFEQLQQKMWKLGTSPNGVFGIKHSMHQDRYNKLFNEVLQLRSIIDPDPNHQEVWSALFPNCKHLYLTRRNKVRLAVSWWKAIQDNVWHIESKGVRKQTAEFYEDKYNFDALTHLFKEAMLKEAAMQAYFERYQIVPLTIVYEDFIRDYETTIHRILDYLELADQDYTIGPMFYKKTSDDHSEQWVERFRNDLQKDWKERPW